MEEGRNKIKDLDPKERKDEVFVESSLALEHTARDAFIEGRRHFAAMSINMAQAITAVDTGIAITVDHFRFG